MSTSPPIKALQGRLQRGPLALHVVPAKAGTQWRSHKRHWIPAFAGMTTEIFRDILILTVLDSRFRGNDDKGYFATF